MFLCVLLLWHGAGLLLYDDLPFECFCWMASEKRPSALQHQHRELNATPADLPCSWMLHFIIRSPHQCLRGTSLSGHCTDQCFLNGATTDQQMGAKTKLCPLHFALLSFIVWRGQSHHTVMWRNNDGSTWCRISPGSSEWRQVFSSWTQLSTHDICQFHVTGYSSCLERALENYARDKPNCFITGCGSAVCSVVVGSGGRRD